MRHSNERLPWRAVQSHEGFNHLKITSSKNPARRITDSPLSSHSFENPQSDQEFQKYDDDFKKIALQWEIPAVESIEKEIDPSTDEGVKDLRDYVATKRFEIDGWRNSEYFLQSSETIQAFYQSLGLKISDLSDLLRHQDESLFSFNEAFSQGDNIGAEKVELEISQRAERIIDTYNAVEEKLDELDIAVNQEEENTGGAQDKKIETEETHESNEMGGGEPPRVDFNQLQRTARDLFNEGLRRKKNDFSEHLSEQNLLLLETLNLARDEVYSRIDDLRKRQKKGEEIDPSEIEHIEAELQRMVKAVDLMPSVSDLHTKEDFERPEGLAEAEIEEYRQVFEKSETLLREVTLNLTQETFVSIQDLYEELQNLVETVQDRVNNVLGRGDILVKEKQAFKNDVGRILELKQQIEKATTKKTGWWDKDFQKEQGVLDVTDVTPTQKWGEQDGPIGFEPPQTEPEEDKERTGWWKDEYREDLGFGPSVSEGPLTQRGDLSVPGDPDSLNTDRFVSEPVSGGRKGEVKWSVQEAEGLSAEPVTADSLSNEPEATPPKEETINAPVNPAYEQVRQEWMGAKAEHEIKRQEYLTAVDDFYKNWSEEISNKGFFGKIGSSIKAKFGFKPDLPEEVLALREASFAATEIYGQKAREMTEKRELAGKKSRGEISEAMLERYNRRFGHEAVFNTFKAQVESQAAAAESLGFKPGKISSFLIENKNVIKLTGAAALGAATGGLAGLAAGGAWWLRSATGAAAAGGAAGFANKKWTENINRWSEEQQEAEVRSLAEKINDKSLTKEEISEQYEKLEAILAQVDEKNRAKMLKVIATAGITGALVGGAAGAIGEEVFGIGAEVETVDGDVPSVDGPAGAGVRVTGAPADASPEATAQSGDAGQSAIAEAPAEKAPEYVAQKGDNLWDILEGQTDAGKPAYLDHVAEGDRQRLIALVAERVNQDDALRAELGFGETADDLNLGTEVDTTRLNEIAEEIAKEKGLYIEASPDAAGAPQATKTPLADADQPKVLDAKAAPEAAVVTNVSPDRINDFAHSYPKGLYPTGFQNFNHDFQTQWVDKIQGPPPASGGFLSIFFSNAPNSDSAYNEFDSYEIGDFKKLATVDASVLASRLADKNIDMADYLAWKDEIARWEKEGLVIDSKDRFSDVAEAAFINSLEKTKAV